MKFILDTHALLWFMNNDEALSIKAKKTIENAGNIILLSAASIWEIGIKIKIKKISINSELDSLVANCISRYDFTPLSVNIPHSIKVSELPYIHKDPFDRILIAQSFVENAALITADKEIAKYDCKTIW